MARTLCIFIGGSDEQNGDFSLVHKLAKSGKTANWSSLKGSKAGDHVLIYIQQPHSALVAKAEVLADAKKSDPSDYYAYRARIGRIEILPCQMTIDELKRAFPRWPWLKYPRSKANVPDQYADRLWKMVHTRGSSVQIAIANAELGKSNLEKMARTRRSMRWSVPMQTEIGDTVMFYVAKPVSAIIAVGKATSKPKASEGKWYEAMVGNVRLLDVPIPLSELREMFPDWAWLRWVNMFSYVSQARAKALLDRCSRKVLNHSVEVDLGSGAGFGSAENNKRVEQAAIRRVTQHLKSKGYAVQSRERDRIGYDLEAKKGRSVLHVEVKGVSGGKLQFPITTNEVRRAESDPSFRLLVVTQAPTKTYRIHTFRGADVVRSFDLKALSYMAQKK